MTELLTMRHANATSARARPPSSSSRPRPCVLAHATRDDSGQRDTTAAGVDDACEARVRVFLCAGAASAAPHTAPAAAQRRQACAHVLHTTRLVDAARRGEDALVFAYGPARSGKTQWLLGRYAAHAMQCKCGHYPTHAAYVTDVTEGGDAMAATATAAAACDADDAEASGASLAPTPTAATTRNDASAWPRQHTHAHAPTAYADGYGATTTNTRTTTTTHNDNDDDDSNNNNNDDDVDTDDVVRRNGGRDASDFADAQSNNNDNDNDNNDDDDESDEDDGLVWSFVTSLLTPPPPLSCNGHNGYGGGPAACAVTTHTQVYLSALEHVHGEWCDLLGRELNNVHDTPDARFVHVTTREQLRRVWRVMCGRRLERFVPHLTSSLSHAVVQVRCVTTRRTTTTTTDAAVPCAGSVQTVAATVTFADMAGCAVIGDEARRDAAATDVARLQLSLALLRQHALRVCCADAATAAATAAHDASGGAAMASSFGAAGALSRMRDVWQPQQQQQQQQQEQQQQLPMWRARWLRFLHRTMGDDKDVRRASASSPRLVGLFVLPAELFAMTTTATARGAGGSCSSNNNNNKSDDVHARDTSYSNGVCAAVQHTMQLACQLRDAHATSCARVTAPGAHTGRNNNNNNNNKGDGNENGDARKNDCADATTTTTASLALVLHNAADDRDVVSLLSPLGQRVAAAAKMHTTDTATRDVVTRDAALPTRQRSRERRGERNGSASHRVPRAAAAAAATAVTHVSLRELMRESSPALSTTATAAAAAAKTTVATANKPRVQLRQSPPFVPQQQQQQHSHATSTPVTLPRATVWRVHKTAPRPTPHTPPRAVAPTQATSTHHASGATTMTLAARCAASSNNNNSNTSDARTRVTHATVGRGESATTREASLRRRSSSISAGGRLCRGDKRSGSRSSSRSSDSSHLSQHARSPSPSHAYMLHDARLRDACHNNNNNNNNNVGRSSGAHDNRSLAAVADRLPELGATASVQLGATIGGSSSGSTPSSRTAALMLSSLDVYGSDDASRQGASQTRLLTASAPTEMLRPGTRSATSATVSPLDGVLRLTKSSTTAATTRMTTAAATTTTTACGMACARSDRLQRRPTPPSSHSLQQQQQQRQQQQRQQQRHAHVHDCLVRDIVDTLDARCSRVIYSARLDALQMQEAYTRRNLEAAALHAGTAIALRAMAAASCTGQLQP